jgi:NADH dehydrogenase
MGGDHLKVRQGPAAGTELAFTAEVWIGRDAEAGGNLGGDEYLSRHHARISHSPGSEPVIEDLGSMNGTLVNGERLRGSRVLQDGDTIKVGHTVLEVVLAATVVPAADPELETRPSSGGRGRFEATEDLAAAQRPPAPSPQPVALQGEPAQAAHRGAEPLRRARRPPPVVGSPSVIRAGLPPSMKGLIFPSVGLLIVQIIVGWEWLISGLTKIFRGGFPSGLGANLKDSSTDAWGWYRDFLRSVIIPHAKLFGYLIEISELAVGVILIVAALQWLFRWQSMHRQARTRMLLGTVAACGAAIFMNINFYLVSGKPPPFFLAKDAFDEGVGLDAVLPSLEFVIGGVALWTFLSIRRARNAPAPGGEPSHVVVAGGGFAGLSAARALRRYAPASVQVTVVSDTNFQLYTPLLPGVAAGSLEATSAVIPLREQLAQADVRLGRIVGGDPGQRELVFEPLRMPDRPGGEAEGSGAQEAIGYDELIIAVGSVSRTRNIPGLARYAIGLKTLSEAVALRNWLIRTLEVAEAFDDAEERRPYLTYMFAGAGYAGVEGIAELHDFAAKTLKFYPRCQAQGTRWVLIQSGDRIMPETDRSLAEFAARKLNQRGIEIMTGTRLAEVTESSVRLSTGEALPTRTVVWTAGVRAHPVVEEFGLPLDEQGRIVVSSYLQVAGQQHVWAVGDAAAVPDADAGGARPCPPTAQHAIQQGRAVAANVAAVLGSGHPKPFAYRSRGAFIDLGKHTAVAEVWRLRVRGRLAWFLARAYHASRMPGLRRKFRLLSDWGLDMFQGRDTSELGALGHPRSLMGELEEKSAGGSVVARHGAGVGP